jgi:hypothetical protein
VQPPEEEVTLTRQRLSAADGRLVALAAAIIVCSGLFLWYNYRAAFPQASLELKLSPAAIATEARQFVWQRGWRVDDFRQVTVFEPDDDTRLFLERQLGLAEANRLMSDEVVVWQWRVRWYRPPQREEVRVWLTPDGRIAGFDHTIPEDAPGAHLAREEARGIAAAHVPAGYRLVDEQSEEKPRRIDHVFEYERENFNIEGATYRRQLVVRGAELAASRQYLKIPEQWRREFTAARSKNLLFAQIAQAFYVPLIVVAIIVLIQGLRRRQLHYRPLVRASALIALLMVLTEWNNLPLSLDSLPSSTAIPEATALLLFQGIGAGVAVFFYVILAAAPGEWLYRRRFPHLLPPGTALSAAGIQTREFFRACISGYAMAAGHLAFVTLFYLIGQRFGVWTPQDVEYSNLLSTALPWLYPLTISLLAASSEEAWFRLLAIPLLARWRIPAMLLPAFVWGFLHSNYPQQPAWIRGVEVGLIGVVAALVMFRFGILATLVWHYTVDAVLIGSFLFQAQGWYYRATGALVAGVVMLPLAVSLYRYRRHGGFLPAGAIPPPAVAPDAASTLEPPPQLPPFAPLWSPRLFYLLAALVGLAGILAAPTRYGDFLQVKLTRQQALAAAGAPAPGERAVAEYLPNLPTAEIEYLRRHGANVNDVIARFTEVGLWRIRFFKPLERRERSVYVDSTARIVREDFTLGENDGGARLDQHAARAVAHQYLARQGIDPAMLREVDAATESLPNRTDHFFVWEHPSLRFGDAAPRVSLALRGDQPSELRRFLKLPEAWERDFRRVRLQRYLLPAAGGAAGITLLLLFLRHLPRHPLCWRRYLAGGAAAAALLAASFLNASPSWWSSYNTAQPPNDFLADVALRLLMQLVLAGFAATLGMLLLDVLLEARPVTPASWLAAPALVALFGGALRLIAWGESFVPGDRFLPPLWAPPPVDDWSPALAVLLSGAGSALVGTLLAAPAIAAFARFFSPRRRLAYGIVLALVVALARSSSPLLVGYTFVTTLVLFALAGLAVRSLGGAVAHLAGAIFLAQALAGAGALARQPATSLRLQGVIALVAALALIAWWLYRFRCSPRSSS